MAKASRRSNRDAKAGAPEWIVTFADLMSILVCFFVLIISFSIQDERKLQVVAGSLRDAFGVSLEDRKAGIIEVNGVPLSDWVRRIAALPQEEDINIDQQRHDQRTKQGPQINTHDIEKSDNEEPRQYSTAAASLRQAWREMPEIMELSDQVIVEEDPHGLNIQIVDRDGRSMFPAGSKHPYERTHVLLANIAEVLRELPNRIAITGHTSSDRSEERENYSNWELSADRANAVRAILAAHGVDEHRFASVSGKADAEPLFPDDSFLTANRRVSILLLDEAPPLPPDHQP